MKKHLFFIIILLIVIFKCDNIYAYKGTITVSSPKNTVTIGDSITVTVNLSTDGFLGGWDFCVDYDKAFLRLTSTNNLPHIADSAKNTTTKKVSFTYTFKTLKTGTTKVSIIDAEMVEYESEEIMPLTINNKNLSIIPKPVVIPKKLSDNNYLSSLSVDGYQLDPFFDKETLIYELEVDNDINEVIVKAIAEDSKAKVLGVGDITVSEGLNKIDVKVVAENGNIKTYTLNIIVKEESPVNVSIDGKDYLIIKKVNDIMVPTGYLQEEREINEELVPVFYNEITELTLIALKNEEGETDLYIVDNKKNTYELYKELSFNKLSLFIKEPKKGVVIPPNYKKTEIVINGLDINAYKLSSDSNYSLIYGMNTETGEEHLYMYDSHEKTIQRYNDEEVDGFNKQLNNHLIVIIGLGATSLILFIIIIILLIRNKKILKRVTTIENNLSQTIN